MSRESSIPPNGYASASSHPAAELDISNLPASYHTLLQKQQEHAGLQALKEASRDMVKRVETLAEMSNVMADGGEGGRS
jgi:DASH complex subunit DAD2